MYTIGPIAALGTHWWLEVYDTAVNQAAVEHWLNRRLTVFTNTYSRFNPNSVISQLNTNRQLSDPSDELLELLSLGQIWYHRTAGLFNFLSASAQEQQGYGQLGNTNTQAFANPQTDLVITETEITLSQGAVDLGGFAKGWLIDSIAATLQHEFNCTHFLINGGGDMYGTSLANGSSIEIAVEHPYLPKLYIATVPLLHQAFAASSTYKRQWQQANKTKTHLLNPNTTETIQPIASHVVAESALEADIYATLTCLTSEVAIPSNIEYCIMPEQAPNRVSPAFTRWLFS